MGADSMEGGLLYWCCGALVLAELVFWLCHYCRQWMVLWCCLKSVTRYVPSGASGMGSSAGQVYLLPVPGLGPHGGNYKVICGC